MCKHLTEKAESIVFGNNTLQCKAAYSLKFYVQIALKSRTLQCISASITCCAQATSSVKWNDLNPEWDEEVIVEDLSLRQAINDCYLHFLVADKDIFFYDDLLGYFSFPLTPLLKSSGVFPLRFSPIQGEIEQLQAIGSELFVKIELCRIGKSSAFVNLCPIVISGLSQWSGYKVQLGGKIVVGEPIGQEKFVQVAESNVEYSAPRQVERNGFVDFMEGGPSVLTLGCDMTTKHLYIHILLREAEDGIIMAKKTIGQIAVRLAELERVQGLRGFHLAPIKGQSGKYDLRNAKIFLHCETILVPFGSSLPAVN